MRSVLKIDVHKQLTLSIFLVILLSWILSSCTSTYLVYREMKGLHARMAQNPAAYPVPFPEPKLSILDFVLGPQRMFPRHHEDGPRPPRDDAGPPRKGPEPPDRNPPPNEMAVRSPGPFPGPPPPGMRSGMPGPCPGTDQHPPFPRQPGPPLPSPAERRFGGVMMATRMVSALLLALIAGAFLSRRFTKPLSELAKGANAYHGGDFKHRIPVRGGDEFARVADTMNTMAECVSVQIAELEEDAKRRQQFLADVAHELRSPVMTIRTMAGALDEGLANDPERKSKAIKSLVGTSDRLFHLVSDLMELAKVDLKELPLHKRDVQLNELISSVVEAHSAAADRAKVVLDFIDDQKPVVLSADPDRLAQVLDNLIDNAISYAGEGSNVLVSVESTDSVEIIVSDNGRGISREHLPYLFDPFYRADAARTPRDHHLGLGLRIAKGLIEAHGGQLSVSSQEGQGTVAKITLPA